MYGETVEFISYYILEGKIIDASWN